MCSLTSIANNNTVDTGCNSMLDIDTHFPHYGRGSIRSSTYNYDWYLFRSKIDRLGPYYNDYSDNTSMYDDYDTYEAPIKEDTHRDSHTLRKWSNDYRYYLSSADINVEVYTDYHPDGTPVTQIDHMVNYKRDFSLHKGYLYDSFINELEDVAVSKTTRYDKRSNMIISTYKVPACGYIASKTKTKRHKPNYTQYYQSETTNEERFIVIGGKAYSNKYLYYPNGSVYSKLKLPADWNLWNSSPRCEPDEQIYVSSNMNHHKDSIDITYHHEISVDCLSLHPSNPQFEFVHNDNHCASTCTKEKHCIQVLKNDPGYITKFDMYYRSSLTGGKWVKHGTFTGGSNWFEPAKVQIEPVMVKELRIVPTGFHNSWDKVKIHSIGKVADKPDVSSDIFVEYRVSTPGAPRTQIPDNYHHGWKIDRDTSYYRDRLNDKFKDMKESSDNFDPYCDYGCCDSDT